MLSQGAALSLLMRSTPVAHGNNEDLVNELEWLETLIRTNDDKTQASLKQLRDDVARLKVQDTKPDHSRLEARLSKLEAQLEGLSARFFNLSTAIKAPKRIIRDDAGLITRVETDV